MSSAPRAGAIVAGALVVLVLVAGAAVIALRGGLGEVAGGSPGPDPSTSELATPSPDATASPEPVETPPGDVLAIFREIEVQVRQIRGLPAADIGPPEVITRAELAVELRQAFDEEYPPEEREADNIALRAMGLLEPGQDVAELQLDLLSVQVLGFYDDTDKRMVVVSDAGLDAEAKITYAHEYTHALQDAAFGLDSLETDADGEDDRGLARTALIEGDATQTMFLWALAGNLTRDELLELGQTPVPDTGDVPEWMIATLEFPYAAGLQWTQQLYAQDGYAAVDEAFADPPSSTEQILHFEKWQAGEEPIAIQAPDIATALGDGWEEVDETPIGEALIAIVLEYFGVSPVDAAAAAAGWGGDRSVVASGPDDAFALAWILAWDATADADQFSDAYQLVLDELPFPAALEQLSSGETLVVHASTDDLLARTLEAARER